MRDARGREEANDATGDDALDPLYPTPYARRVFQEKGGRAMYEVPLARVRLFHDLARRELTWLSEGCRECDFVLGTPLVRARERSASLFILLGGSVVPLLSEDDGTERPAGVFGPGTVIGELALCDGAPVQHTITALEACSALVLPHRDFQATLRESPDIAIKLLGVLGARLRQGQADDPRRSPDLYCDVHTNDLTEAP